MELQQMQLDERELYKKCLALSKKLKIHLRFVQSSFHIINLRLFQIAFHIFFREEHQTFREKMYHNLNQLHWQLKRDSCHGHNSKTCLGHDSKTLFGRTDKLIDERVLKYKELRIKEREVQAIKEIEKWLKESELQQQESLVTEGSTLEACLITEGATIEACLITKGETLEACLVNEGIAVNDNTGVTESSQTESENSSSATPFSKLEDENRSSDKDSSSLMNECSRPGNENRSFDHESTSSGNDADADTGPSFDSDTVTEVPHSSNDTFENMFAHGIQSHKQPESISDTYEVNENTNNIISDIPNMDPDRNKEEHDDVDYEHQRAFFASLINNLKCDVEKCNEVNCKAQQANDLLTNELERYKEKEKHFAIYMTIESEYCKKIKLLNDEILYLKSQACEKDKTFAKENGKFDELRKAGQTDQTLRMLLPKEDNVNTRKQGLSFENQNDYVNLILLNKAKEFAPCLYNIDEMGKDELSDHKISSEEELKCKAEKLLKVQQRKSPLSYHGFIYVETQFEEPPKVPLKRRNVILKEHLEQVQLRNYDPKLWNSHPMKYFCYVKQAMLKSEKQIFSKIELNRGDLFRMSFEQSINE
ncbi:hypothetical protein Tco_0223384 [Tanacetum coccineum]